MSIEGILLQPGEAQSVSPPRHTGGFPCDRRARQRAAPCSNSLVAPGFDTGAHYHTTIEEIFYVLEGELTLRAGDRRVQGGPGTFVFVPIGAAIPLATWVKPSADAARHDASRA